MQCNDSEKATLLGPGQEEVTGKAAVKTQGTRTTRHREAVSSVLAAQLQADTARAVVAEHAFTITQQRSLLAALSRQASNAVLRERARQSLLIAQQRLTHAALELRRAEDRVAVARRDLTELEQELGLPRGTDRRCIRCGGTGRYSFRADLREMCLRCSGSGVDPGPHIVV